LALWSITLAILDFSNLIHIQDWTWSSCCHLKGTAQGKIPSFTPHWAVYWEHQEVSQKNTLPFAKISFIVFHKGAHKQTDQIPGDKREFSGVFFFPCL